MKRILSIAFVVLISLELQAFDQAAFDANANNFGNKTANLMELQKITTILNQGRKKARFAKITVDYYKLKPAFGKFVLTSPNGLSGNENKQKYRQEVRKLNSDIADDIDKQVAEAKSAAQAQK